MLVGVAMKNINKKEVVGWMKFWALGEKLAHGVVEVLLLSYVGQEHRSNIGGVRAAGGLPIRHRGAQEVRTFTHLHLQGVGDLQVLQVNCSCLD